MGGIARLADPPLLCPVRGCGLGLLRRGRAFACEGGHSFDVARSGYLNLLQPQDRKSATPGDAPEAVRARVRLYEAGVGTRLVEDLAPLARGLVLDVGCGPGFLLSALRSGCGVDLSAEAVDAAAKREKHAFWVVANADRRLPFGDASFDTVFSVAGPKNPLEFARVLRPEGRVILAVPAPDDLIELREAVLGRPLRAERARKAAAAFVGLFGEEERRESRERRQLAPDRLRDLLCTTYRGQRRSAAERAAALPPLDVTLAADVLVLRRR